MTTRLYLLSFIYLLTFGEQGTYAQETSTRNTTDGTTLLIGPLTRTPGGSIFPNVSVSVVADVYASEGVASVVLEWGQKPDNLTSVRQMTRITASNTYETATAIPGQSNGITIYYQVLATDNLGQEVVSSQGTYTASSIIDPPVGDIIRTKITEIMHRPATISDEVGEYFEIFNGEDEDVDIEGWTLSDNGTDVHIISNGAPLIIPSGGFLVLGNNADITTNGGVVIDYEYSDFELDDDSDEIKLRGEGFNEFINSSYGVAPEWPNTDAGVAMVFTGSVTENSFNNGSLWAEATRGEDITTGLGSPGIEGNDQFLTNVLIYTRSSWTPQVPSAGVLDQKVIVLDGFPLLSEDTFLKSLQLREETLLEVKGITLDITGDIINNGWIVGKEGGTITANGTSDQLFKGSGHSEVGSLKVDNPNSLALDHNLDIYDTVTILSGDLHTQDVLTFKSTLEKTAMLDKVPSSSTITGNVTTERFIPSNMAIRFLTSAVTTSTSINANWQEGASNATENPNPGFGTHITGSRTGANGFDQTPSGKASMFRLNVSQSFQRLLNTDMTVLTAGTPYLTIIRGSRAIDITDNQAAPDDTVLRATGTLVTGDQTQSFITTTETAGTAGRGSFFFLGNPYQSSVDMTSVLASDIQNINRRFYYVWDPNLNGGNGNGGYVAIDLRDGTNAAGSEANQFLQPGQGAFVSMIANSPDLTTSVTFQEEDKNVGQNTNTFAPETTEASIIGRLYRTQDGEHTLSDSFKIDFDSSYSNEVNLLDAPKPTNFDENFALATDGNFLAIERRAIPEDNEIIHLELSNYRETAYELFFDIEEIPSTFVYLIDAFEATQTRLQVGINTIAFTVDVEDASAHPDRFQLLFTSEPLSVEEETLFDLSIFPNPIRDNQLNITSTPLANTQVTVSLSNLLGQKVYSEEKTFSGNHLTLTDLPVLGNGIYLLSLKSNNGTVTKRIIKN